MKKKREIKYQYIGPPAPSLVLASGYKLVDPAGQNGEALRDLLQREPQLQQYYREVKDKPKEEQE